MTSMSKSDVVQSAVLRVYERLDMIKPCPNWVQRSEQSLWHELVACMLGSRVSFEHAQAAAYHLRASGLLNVADCFRDGDEFESKICTALSAPIYPPLTRLGIGRKYQFPRVRANHIRRSADSIYQQCESIKSLLYSSNDSREARVKIISAALGIGPKQSSLFLRNIGYADDLAILDTHVMHYMCLLGLLTGTEKQTTQLTVYEKMEERLKAYAERLKAIISRLDTAIWVVMRVFQKEFAQ
jgi:N-glycosylase/DNA lyase